MDPLSWINSLPDPIKATLIGAAGDFSGGLTAQAVAALLGMASGQVRKRLRPTAQQSALHQAMAEALAVTARTYAGDDEVRLAHFLDIFGQWIAREDAAIELAKVIEPQPDTSLDVDLLVREFAAAGFDDEWLGEEVDFADVVAAFARAFYDAAASQEELQGAIEIGLLRGIAERTDALVQQSKAQTQLQTRIASAVEREHPLFLTRLEQRYLAGVYAEANDLPLADDDRPEDERTLETRPRLQRVYVDLRTTAWPDRERIDTRLSHMGVHLGQVELAFNFHVGEGASPLETVEPHTAWADRDYWTELTDDIRRLSDGKRSKLAEFLNLEGDDLSAAFANLAILEAIQEHPQLVLLGDPGSGKSTLTRRLAGLLAASGCAELQTGLSADEVAAAQALENGYGRWLLPVRVVLSRWAEHLPADTTGCADDLIAECLRVLGQAGHAGDDQRRHFLTRLSADPPTAFLLLDGLDEVTDRTQRRTLLDAVRHFSSVHGRVPLIVTCRVRPYDALRKADQALPLNSFTLDRLPDAEVRRFVARWHAEHARTGLYPPEQAEKASHQLLDALADPARDELHDMAGTPLLLTMMARVNYRHGLPDSRAQLYERYVNQLLYEWERRKLGAPDDPGQRTRLRSLLDEAGVSAGSLNNALNKLAYAVHGQAGDRDTVEIPQAAVRAALEAIHPGAAAAKAAWAVEVLALIDERSGLLYARELQTAYTFTHRTFQEYLAARYLATGRSLGKFRAKIDDERWREALLLALGFQTRVQNPPAYDAALDVFDELLPDAPAGERDWRRVLLLGEAYVRLLGPQRAGEADQRQRAERVVARVPRLLTAAMQSRDLPPRTRLEAGLLLDELGIDPPGLDDFVGAPGWGFRIARYPVTNRQFRRFWQAGGYDERRWWSDEGWDHCQQFDLTKPRSWGQRDFDRPSQPVVSVSWHEAEAWCVWLTARLREEGAIDVHEEVRLPSRTEWETAAHASERTYTWGDDFDPGLANTEESGLDRPTPVHMYVDAATGEGVWDLIGNVYEWVGDREGSRAWLKGGGWRSPRDRVAASAAVRRNPRHLRYGSGFRCVVVPISRGQS